jgi:hypothetical protein
MSDRSELELQRQRGACNQSLSPDVNERIEDLASDAAFAGFICECLDSTCEQQISLTLEEYERVRSASNQFLVLPGHEILEAETVIDTSDRFLVVAKVGAGEAVAEHLDPRKRTGVWPSRRERSTSR